VDRQGVRGVRFRRHPDTGRSVRLPGRLWPDGGAPAAATPARRQRVTLGSLVGAGHAGQVDAAGQYRRSGRANTGRRLPDIGSPRAPGAADTRDRRRGIRTPRQQARWTAGSRGVHRRSRCPTGKRPQGTAAAGPTARRQGRRLVITVDLVGSDTSGLLRLGASSIQTDPDGSRRILWIRGMIKRPGGRAPRPARRERAAAKWPHPYHGSGAHRRAIRRLRRSCDTVGAAVMCSVADRLGGAGLEWLRTLSVGGLAGGE
jgi:hypothetical protein